MNWQLFSAFLVITLVLFLTPGPIVTLVVTTGARSGSRAALLTVAGASTGNAVLVACIAFGLSWVLKTSSEIFDYLRWIGAAYLVWLGIQAWRHAGATAETAPPRGHVYAWRGFHRGDHQSEIDRVLHGVPAAIHRSGLAGRTSVAGDVRGVGLDGRRCWIAAGASRPASAAPGS